LPKETNIKACYCVSHVNIAARNLRHVTSNYRHNHKMWWRSSIM